VVIAGGIPVRGLSRKEGRLPEAKDGLLLVGHGSRCHLSVQEMQWLGDMVADELPSTAIEVGFLEMNDPPAGEAIDRLAERGCERVAVLPLVLLGAGHAKNDSPAVVIEARERHPGIDFRFGAPLGVAREPVELLGKSVVAAGGAGLPLLVLARGSSDPDANSDAYKAARLVAEWAGSPFVNVGFSGITGPSVSEAAEAMARLGHSRVAVAWWFLCHGRLVDRGRSELAEAFGGAGVEQIDAGYIGPDRALVPLVVRRYREALGFAAAERVGASGAGEVSGAGEAGGAGGVSGAGEAVNCDLCVYRAPWPGREERVGQAIGVGHSHLAAAHRHSH
jgi:sirohydrochlorin cobaltochelatase